MNKKLWLCLFVIVLALSACSGGTQATQAPNGDASANPTPPPEYVGKTNPVKDDQAAIGTGKQLYATNCTSCHGTLAKGDGPAAAALNPKPKNLAGEMSQLNDDYVFWRISEGGMKAPFHSAMPAWKSILSEEQIWQIIAYMHTLQP